MFMSGSKKVAVHCHGFSSMLHLGSTTAECTALLESHLQREFGKSRDLEGSMDVRRSAILCHNSTYHMNESHSCANSQALCKPFGNELRLSCRASVQHKSQIESDRVRSSQIESDPERWHGEDPGCKLVHHTSRCLIQSQCRAECFAILQSLGCC